MLKRLKNVLGILLILVIVLYLGDYTIKDFGNAIDIKKPSEVLKPVADEILPELVDPNLNLPEISPPKLEEPNINLPELEKPKEPKLNAPGSEKESLDEEITNKFTAEDLDELVKSIRVKKGDKEIPYVRDSYEKPVKTFKVDGKTYTRNRYLSYYGKFLISREPFKYECPYTGVIITDPKKIDADHIFPLSEVHKSGGYEWSDEKRNQYAYDTEVLVNVLNSSNRSKGAKTPSQWLPDRNVERFCYTYLYIANKYDLEMSQEDIDVCKYHVLNGINSGLNLELLSEEINE